MNVTGSHVAGGSAGAILAVILAALDKKIGLNLTDAEAASFALALAGIGGAVGHALANLYQAGLIPTLHQLLHGAKTATK